MRTNERPHLVSWSRLTAIMMVGEEFLGGNPVRIDGGCSPTAGTWRPHGPQRSGSRALSLPVSPRRQGLATRHFTFGTRQIRRSPPPFASRHHSWHHRHPESALPRASSGVGLGPVPIAYSEGDFSRGARPRRPISSAALACCAITATTITITMTHESIPIGNQHHGQQIFARRPISTCLGRCGDVGPCHRSPCHGDGPCNGPGPIRRSASSAPAVDRQLGLSG